MRSTVTHLDAAPVNLCLGSSILCHTLAAEHRKWQEGVVTMATANEISISKF